MYLYELKGTKALEYEEIILCIKFVCIVTKQIAEILCSLYNRYLFISMPFPKLSFSKAIIT